MLAVRCVVCGGPMRSEVTGLFDDRYGHPDEFSVTRCVECGFMSTEPRLSESDLPALYSTYYPRSKSTPDGVRSGADAMAIGTRRGRLRARLLTGQWSAHYEISPGMRVLDYGCGDCTSLLEIRALGADPYGMEVDPTVRELAKGLDVKVHIGTIDSLPESDGSFDAVTLSQVIEHVTDPETLLRSLWSKLKPGGIIVLTTPNSRSVTRRLLRRRWLHWHIPFHQNHFHADALRRLLTRAGFRIEKSRTFTPVPWWEYQAEMLLRSPERGRPHPYFGRGESVIQSSLIGRVLLRPGRFVAAIVARAVDAMGLGESLLVVARKAPA